MLDNQSKVWYNTTTMGKQLNTQWSAHIKDPEERKEFEGYIRNSTTLLTRLTDILKQRVEHLECPPKADYDKAGWAYEQADRIGQLRVCKELLKLTDLQ
jgi:hypothetical protein